MTVILAACAAAGMYLILTPNDASPAGSVGRMIEAGRGIGDGLHGRLTRSGLDDVSLRQFVAVSLSMGLAATFLTWVALGAVLPAVFVGLSATALPTALWRRRAGSARTSTMEAWPRMIEEIRVRVGSVGQPIPQALLETGSSAPEPMRAAFEAARREWGLTTDFEATCAVLKTILADATADTVCETLLVIHEVGGDADPRLEALAADRRADLRHRREADARAAGARFARWFVVIVPAGMAFAGLNLGEGRMAYGSFAAQVATVLAIAMVAGCWWWAGRIMATPAQGRVFDR